MSLREHGDRSLRRDQLSRNVECLLRAVEAEMGEFQRAWRRLEGASLGHLSIGPEQEMHGVARKLTTLHSLLSDREDRSMTTTQRSAPFPSQPLPAGRRTANVPVSLPVVRRSGLPLIPPPDRPRGSLEPVPRELPSLFQPPPLTIGGMWTRLPVASAPLPPAGTDLWPRWGRDKEGPTCSG